MDHDVPTFAYINRNSLQHNAQRIREFVQCDQVLYVVKADAYGHGIVECAQCLEQVGADYFGVATVLEGIELRDAGIETPILVFGSFLERQIDSYLNYNLTFSIPSVDKLQMVDEYSQRRGILARVHIKIDTGMGRIGTHWDRLDRFIDTTQETNNIIYEGIYSHFADAGDNREFTTIQFDRFEKAYKKFESAGTHFSIRHICNSHGMSEYPEMHLDMVRTGLALYGVMDTDDTHPLSELRPVMELKTQVVFFKTVHPGETVGYGMTWTPINYPERIVTLPIGYADGYGTRFDNRTQVLIHGNLYPVIGRVCMDQCMVSLGSTGQAYNGDEVILIGRQGNKEISVNDLAENMNTIAYEVLVHIGKRVRRIYIN